MKLALVRQHEAFKVRRLRAIALPAAFLTALATLAIALLWSVWGSLAPALDTQAWRALWADPQTLHALGLSIWTGVASTLMVIAAAAWMLCASFGSPAETRLQRWLAPMLAVPHAAFAIGLVALLAPSGWLLRVLSPWATGLNAPPPWPTTQDPWGLGLIMVLALKEIPFLLWTAAACLQRPDLGQRLRQELQLAHTLGYSAPSAWWRVAWPQLAPKLAAPALAVWAYSLTVVDVALVIGPGAPPTLAVLAWQWLQDADTARNAQGAAAAWLLTGVVAVGAAAVVWLARAPVWRRRWSAGLVAQARTRSKQRLGWARGSIALLGGAYAAVLLALLLGSVIGQWPFPALWPRTFTWGAWLGVMGSLRTVGTTLWLAFAASAAALALVVAWLEFGSQRAQVRWQWVLYAPLVLPPVLWVVGLHRMTLDWGVEGSGPGVWLAHTLVCLPYVHLALVGPYNSFNPRAWQVAATLGHSRWSFVWRVQWPLLRAALASGFAVGFSVSVAQYLPTLYVGAGRLATVTTEAVTLASGGQRSLAAAFAWLQWLLPVAVFALAAALGRARRFKEVLGHNSAQPAGTTP